MINKKYTIKEVSELLDIKEQTVRYYESKGLVNPERNDDNNYREYTMNDVVHLYYCIKYRQLGLPIKEIKDNFMGGGYEEALRMLVDKKRKEIIKSEALLSYMHDSLKELTELENKDIYIQNIQDTEFVYCEIDEHGGDKKTLDELIPVTDIGAICKFGDAKKNNYTKKVVYIIEKKYLNSFRRYFNIDILKCINIKSGFVLYKKDYVKYETYNQKKEEMIDLILEYVTDLSKIDDYFIVLPQVRYREDSQGIYNYRKIIVPFK